MPTNTTPKEALNLLNSGFKVLDSLNVNLATAKERKTTLSNQITSPNSEQRQSQIAELQNTITNLEGQITQWSATLRAKQYRDALALVKTATTDQKSQIYNRVHPQDLQKYERIISA
jgi:predicted  nucleic acid-binding Zn-ribbon protein